MEDKELIFICVSAAKSLHKKLSGKVATQLEELKIGEIGNLEMLSHQHAAPAETRRKMLFLNDCRSGCVRVLTHGFQSDQYLFFDVSSHTHSTTIDIDSYINSEVLPKMNEQWNRRNQTNYPKARI